MKRAYAATLARCIACIACIAFALVACSSGNAGGGLGADANDSGAVSDAGSPSDARAADGAAPDHPGDAGGGDGSSTTTPFDAGPACTRRSDYDTQCATLAEPPSAYVCYDPGGGHIPTTCTINKGTLLVCCPP